MSEFKWTDETVKEFILTECNKYCTWDEDGLNIWIDKFKKSKEPNTVIDFHHAGGYAQFKVGNSSNANLITIRKERLAEILISESKK